MMLRERMRSAPDVGCLWTNYLILQSRLSIEVLFHSHHFEPSQWRIAAP